MTILHSLLNEHHFVEVMPTLCSHMFLTDGETWETLPPLCSLVQALPVLPALLLHYSVKTTLSLFSSDQGILSFGHSSDIMFRIFVMFVFCGQVILTGAQLTFNGEIDVFMQHKLNIISLFTY